MQSFPVENREAFPDVPKPKDSVSPLSKLLALKSEAVKGVPTANERERQQKQIAQHSIEQRKLLATKLLPA